MFYFLIIYKGVSLILLLLSFDRWKDLCNEKIPGWEEKLF